MLCILKCGGHSTLPQHSSQKPRDAGMQGCRRAGIWNPRAPQGWYNLQPQVPLCAAASDPTFTAETQYASGAVSKVMPQHLALVRGVGLGQQNPCNVQVRHTQLKRSCWIQLLPWWARNDRAKESQLSLGDWPINEAGEKNLILAYQRTECLSIISKFWEYFSP